MTPQAILRATKAAHTVVWAFFVGCILAIPFYSWRGEFRIAWVLVAIVCVEVAVLLANNWRCPMTDLAARYTEDQPDNFDIYLPLWLARYNKQVFGGLFAAGLLYTLVRQLGLV
jgi:hypothetical protein